MTRTEPGLATAVEPPARRKLPIGIQTFSKIREDGYYYVDKTACIRRLADEGTHYFLSRPRRFGKSLLVDTIKELFEGNEPLFRGLDVHGSWDWSISHPVVRLDFSGDFRAPGNLHKNLMRQLDRVERRAGVSSPHQYDTAADRFGHLIETLHEHAERRVAVLIDEYDKPILDALDTPEVARANRDFLHGVYSIIKSCDADIVFTLLTGVSKFSRVSLFSGLNNLLDITLDPSYSTICGYTDRDLDTVFAPELAGLDRQAIRDWYNGYHWLGDEKVYNPYDILLLFRERRFDAHWFETGTPTFLVRTLLGRGVGAPELDGMSATGDLLSAFDVDGIETEALLFQTGYLTITDVDDSGGEPEYRLGYPNREVRQSLNRRLLRAMVPEGPRRAAPAARLRRLLAANDFKGLEALFRGFFAGIPYEWHTRNRIADYEGYYASVFYSHFTAAGMDVVVEESSSQGRLDMAVRFNGNVYLFEFKVVESSADGSAMAQLRERGYADKYRGSGQPIHLIGVEFSEETRNLAAFKVAPV